MFTPLSKGSERRQYREWDENPTTPDRNRSTRSRSSRKSSRQPISPFRTPNPRNVTPSRRDHETNRYKHQDQGHQRYDSTTHLLAKPQPRPYHLEPLNDLPRNKLSFRTRWSSTFLQPSKQTVNTWLDSWWKRHFVLVVAPCLFVWVWVAVPFPAHDATPNNDETGSLVSRRRDEGGGRVDKGGSSDDGGGYGRKIIEPNFAFFLFYYYGIYLATALLFITKLFDLYRLNWWPRSLGGLKSYTFFWATSLAVGFGCHWGDVFGIGRRRSMGGGQDGQGDEVDWERKTFWIALAFLTMLMPAFVCFSKLKRDRRHTFRHSLTELQKAFLEREAARRIPASWERFLWFMTVLGIASFSLVVGQAFASLYLKTLPHTSIDATVWVWSWIATVNLLNGLSVWIISTHIRSRALLFLYKYFFQVVLFTFYRNLFARLRSPQQFALIQLVSSLSVITLQPIQVTRIWYKTLQIVIGYGKSYEEHLDAQAITFYVRGVAQNVTILGFLGWLSILHFGTNSRIYPFFAFNYSKDPYTFQLTFLATVAIWAIELLTSWVTRRLMKLISKVDVTEAGLYELREFPELTVACGWTSVHILSNILLFLIRLDFK